MTSRVYSSFLYVLLIGGEVYFTTLFYILEALLGLGFFLALKWKSGHGFS